MEQIGVIRGAGSGNVHKIQIKCFCTECAAAVQISFKKPTI